MRALQSRTRGIKQRPNRSEVNLDNSYALSVLASRSTDAEKAQEKKIRHADPNALGKSMLLGNYR